MRDELERHGRLDDVDVAVVTFARAKFLDGYRQHLDIPFSVLSDEHRDTYRAYGLGRGSLRRIYRPATIKKYAQLMRAGKKLRRPTDDTRQLGGDFVVGADGLLRFAYRPVAPDDRPAPADMIAALDSPPSREPAA
ncbi:MAG TPA: AhpC/TSA family protein [Acidimicrobiales bacterium]|nr:AhpC/TSA family protein [Acidimicrobiales bacterium]